MVASAASVPVAETAPRVRWSYLWSRRSDITFNFVPFWIGLVLVGLLYAARNIGAMENPVNDFTVAGVHIHLATWVMYFYGPLVDAPHLWATIARTYTDRDEWAQRRTLFIASLTALLLGPIVILFPYVLRAVSLLPAGRENVGWLLWSNFFTFYALFHINKQHWGFVALYRRKNKDTDSREMRIDQLFFYTAIWAPFAAMVTAPWYTDYDGKPLAFTHGALGSNLYSACHVVFFVATIAYVAYQVDQYRKGVSRNGPKLAYLATIIPLNYLAFSIHPFVAAFWIVTTGFGHCAQYHRVVWAYGQSQYVAKEKESLPRKIFANLPLYVGLGVLFGIVTLQGFGGGRVKDFIAGGLGQNVFGPMFTYLDAHQGTTLALQVVAACISGIRLHHFYVDSKIWRVSKSAALAKNLNVSPA
jgi:hypothetical protein